MSATLEEPCSPQTLNELRNEIASTPSLHSKTDAIPLSSSPLEIIHEEECDNEDFVSWNKARHDRRLRAHWQCAIEGHSHCYTDGHALHVELTDDHLDHWASSMHDAYATLLIPPPSIASTSTNSASSIYSTHSDISMRYRRPFRLKRNISLTDLQSWRRSCSSDGESFSTATSSHHLGIGYFSGKAIKWVGEKILDIITPIEINRRAWVIKRLLKTLEKQSYSSLPDKVFSNTKSIHRFVDDLLELSTDDYNQKYQVLSKELCKRMDKCLHGVNLSPPKDERGLMWLVAAKIILMSVSWSFGEMIVSEVMENSQGLSIDDFGSSPLALSLRDTMLQENLDSQDSGDMICDLIRDACTKIMSSKVTLSRCHAYDFLYCLYFLPPGRKELGRLGRDGGLLQALSERVFHNPIENIAEYASAASFFLLYADNHPKFRQDVLEKGVHHAISRFTEHMHLLQQRQPSRTELNAIHWLSEFISDASRFEWAISTLLEANCCNILLQALLRHSTWCRPIEGIDYNIIWGLRNIAARGSDLGRSALDKALTPEGTDLLKMLRDSPSGWQEEWMAQEAKVRISEILGGEMSETDFVHIYQHHTLPMLSE